MPKSTGRGVFFAALAVPLALVAAPLTASAEEPDDVVITDQMLAGAVATPDAAAAMASATTTTALETEDVEYVEDAEDVDVWHGPRPDLVYVPETVDVTYSSDDEDATEDATEDAAEDAAEEAVEETSTEAVAAVAPAYEIDVVETDDDVHHWTTGWVGATYEDVAAHAGPDGAWVTSTESGAFSANHGGLSGTDTGAWYEEVTAAAGSDGAYVASIESEAFSSNGWGHGDMVDFDDDATGATYELSAAAAGEDGAWVENVESGAFELD